MRMARLQRDLPRLSGLTLPQTSYVTQRIQNIAMSIAGHQLEPVESKVYAILFFFFYDHEMHIATIFVTV